MKVRALIFACTVLLIFGAVGCQPKKGGTGDLTVSVLHTTDLHGNVFPFDFINDKDGDGSYSRVTTYVDALRSSSGELLLLDAGDILQGQPSAYYYNFVDTLSEHLLASVMNSMKYDAVAIGNHDIETGHPVYDRWVSDLSSPVLAANIFVSQEPTDSSNPRHYFKPFTIVNKKGKRFAIIGACTPSVPKYLPERLWEGMTFTDIVEAVRKIMPEVEAKHPDFVIALVHSGLGKKDEVQADEVAEDAGLALAQEIEGIDLVLLGHDHGTYIDSVMHSDGKKVYILNPGPYGNKISRCDVSFGTDPEGQPSVSVHPQLIDINRYQPDGRFLSTFTDQYNKVKTFVNQPVGEFTEEISSRSAFFRPSTFVDLIHSVQFALFDSVDISLTAPLIADTHIPQGTVHMRDLFKLYKYENNVCLMDLTGAEVRDELEASYAKWVQTMQTSDDPMLRFAKGDDRNGFKLEHPYYNFDTAAGIVYEVDLRQPEGNRVAILSMADGQPFAYDKHYRVVVNSYRASGGGDLLTHGAGLTPDDLRTRTLETRDKDLRFYLMEYITDHSPVHPTIISRWRFVPVEYTSIAIPRDSARLFGN